MLAMMPTGYELSMVKGIWKLAAFASSAAESRHLQRRVIEENSFDLSSASLQGRPPFAALASTGNSDGPASANTRRGQHGNGCREAAVRGLR
jgi:hypothetical protein